METGNTDLVESNYRPVSNISFMAKVVEKVALTQLNEFSSSNCASTSFQMAYKVEYSCETEYSDIKTFNFSVPQRRILPPTLFNCYSITLSPMVSTDIGINAFADDYFLHKYFIPSGPEEITSIPNSEQVLKLIHDWMNGNRLKMNDSKTDFIILGSRQQLEMCQMKSISVCSTAVTRSNIVKYLGAWFDENLNFKHHVGVKCKKCLMESMENKEYWTSNQSINLQTSRMQSGLDSPGLL